MSLVRKLGTGLRITGKAGYYLSVGALLEPLAARTLARSLADTVADFLPTPKLRLPSVSLDTLVPQPSGAQPLPPWLRMSEGWELPLEECRCLAVLLGRLQPRRVFEIGTFRGRTTRLIAERTPPDAVIYTLDRPWQEWQASYPYFVKLPDDLIGETFRDAPIRSKITQLYGNSQQFDFRPYYGQMDAVFVDGDHRFDAVRNDSEEALRLVAPGGIVIWDDYQVSQPGVAHYLNGLSQRYGVSRIEHTRLACYRR